MAADLVALARAWRPDLVVFDPTSWAGPIAAAAVGVPAVRHPWGADIVGAMRARPGVAEAESAAVASLCARLGVREEAELLGRLTVDPCPAGMQQPGLTHERAPVRYVPYNGDRVRHVLPPSARPRICVTWGTTVGKVAPGRMPAGRIARTLAGAGLDVVVAVDAAQRHLLGDLPGDLPGAVEVVESATLHTLLPGCRAVVGHGGAGTIFTGLVHGLPQMVLPLLPDHRFNAQRLAASGAGVVLGLEEATDERVREEALRLLEEPAYAKAAGALGADIAAAPAPAALVPRLARLTARPA
ncbi:glycosyltransferase [Nonomuraea antimicrobica]